MKLQGIDHVALTVRDVKRSVEWYRLVLRMERRYQETWGDVPAVVCAGSTCLALFAAATDQPNSVPDHNTIAMRHLAFRVDWENFQAAQRELKERGIDFMFENHTISHSLYIHDPDGHRIELTTYDLPIKEFEI